MSSELWDRADYGYKQEDDPYQVFFITYSRYLSKVGFSYSLRHMSNQWYVILTAAMIVLPMSSSLDNKEIYISTCR